MKKILILVALLAVYWFFIRKKPAKAATTITGTSTGVKDISMDGDAAIYNPILADNGYVHTEDYTDASGTRPYVYLGPPQSDNSQQLIEAQKDAKVNASDSVNAVPIVQFSSRSVNRKSINRR